MGKVDAGYNWQWGRMVQVDEPMLALMTKHGFEAQHTGGGCMAWERTRSDGLTDCITNGDAGLGDWDEREAEEWTTGRYDAEGDFEDSPRDERAYTLEGAIAALA